MSADKTSAVPTTPGTATPTRKVRLRFSLRSLLLLVLLPGSAALLWLHAEPWYLQQDYFYERDNQWSDPQFLAWSADGQRVVVAARNRVTTFDCETGRELAVCNLEGSPHRLFSMQENRPVVFETGPGARQLPPDPLTMEFINSVTKTLTYEFIDSPLREVLDLTKAVFKVEVAMSDGINAKSEQLLINLKGEKEPFHTFCDRLAELHDMKFRLRNGKLTFMTSEEFKQDCRDSERGSVGMWDLESGELVRACAGPEAQIQMLALSENAAFLIAVTDQHQILVWETASGNLVSTYDMDGTFFAERAVVTNDASHVVIAGVVFDQGAALLMGDRERAPKASVVKIAHKITGATFTPDHRSVVLALDVMGQSDAGTTRFSEFSVCEIQAQEVKDLNIRIDRAHEYDAHRLVMSPDGERLAFAPDSSATRLIDVPKRAVMAELGWHASARFSADAKWLLIGEFDGARLVDASSGEVVFFLPHRSREFGQLVELIRKYFTPVDASPFADTGPPGAPLTPQLSVDECTILGPAGRGRVAAWHKRRPEYWWGLAWLPEFWLAVGLTAALGWSLMRDRRAV